MKRQVDLPRRGAPAAAMRVIETSVDRAWEQLCAREAVEAGSGSELELAETVLNDPTDYPWRVVDAALDRSTCEECHHTLASGPVGCSHCRLHDGIRYLGCETDRPDVPPGNEHGLRVAFAVARNRHRFSPRARCGYELILPELLDGRLPTTAEAQAAKAEINRLAASDLDLMKSIDELHRWAVLKAGGV